MKEFIEMFKNTCWANWFFIVMVGGLAFVSIATLLSGCGNKGSLTLPKNSSDTVITPTPVIQKKN